MAAKETLSLKKKESYVQRKVSDNTKGLYLRKKQLQNKRGAVKKEFKDIQKKIKDSCLEDFKSWVASTVEEMERSDKAGNVRRIYKLVNSITITGKPKKPPYNLTTDKDGNLLHTPEDVATTWKNFLSKKFQATKAKGGVPSPQSAKTPQNIGSYLKKGV